MEIEQLNVNPHIAKALKEMGYEKWTNIQEECIPQIINGKDVFGHSSTGSGKTAAFGIPIIEKIQSGKGIQALILTPTRELCIQVSESLKSFSKYMHCKITSVYGGVGIEPQIHNIKQADVVVGTPGRILDHLKRRTLNLQNIKFLVLDEADKMFEMGFIDDVEEIMSYSSKQKQMLLFSATIPSSVHHLIKKHLNNPVMIKSKIHVDKLQLNHEYYVVKKHEKFSLLVNLLKKNTNGLSMIFCGRRKDVDSVTKNLIDNGISAMAIHGGLSQNRRQYVLESLRNKKINVLVATDVAARGLDIKNVLYVYNYDSPKTSEEYIHRVGRTARAGSTGDAITLLSEHDYENFNRVLSNRSIEIKRKELPVYQQLKFSASYDSHRRFDNNRSYGHNRNGPRKFVKRYN